MAEDYGGPQREFFRYFDLNLSYLYLSIQFNHFIYHLKCMLYYIKWNTYNDIDIYIFCFIVRLPANELFLVRELNSFRSVCTCRLLMIDIQSKMGVLEGKPGNLLFTYNQQAFLDNKYYTAGKLTAWAITHNGPGLRCLNTQLYKLMCAKKPSLTNFDADIFLDEDVARNLHMVLFVLQLQYFKTWLHIFPT